MSCGRPCGTGKHSLGVPISEQCPVFIERTLETQRKWREEHREEILERKRKYNKEHREERNEWKRKWHKEHREEQNKASRKYKEEHREEIREQRRRYNKEHREDDMWVLLQQVRDRIRHREKAGF